MTFHFAATRPRGEFASDRDLTDSLRARSVAALHDPLSCGTTDLLAEAMDRMGDGIILTDGLLRVLHMNRRARAFVSRGLLTTRGGWLQAAVARETNVLQQSVAACVQDGRRSAHVRISARLCVTVMALETSAEQQGVAMIVLRDLDNRQGPPPQSIIAYFGLTPAEARLAREIIKGDGLTRCARRLGIRITTVRSHLKHVFEKTETRRQADLVRLLLSCGTSIVVPEPCRDDQPDDGLACARTQVRR